MADTGSLLVGIAALGTVVVSAWGIWTHRDEHDADYWRTRALDCETKWESDDPAPPRRRRKRSR